MIVMYILYIRSWHNASSSGTGVLKKTGALIATFQNLPCPSFSFQSLSNSGEESQMQMDIKHAAQPLPQAFVWKSVWQIVVDLRRMFDVSWRVWNVLHFSDTSKSLWGCFVFLSHTHWLNSQFYHVYQCLSIWRFPKVKVPPNHPSHGWPF